jgi:hypothetical protein
MCLVLRPNCLVWCNQTGAFLSHGHPDRLDSDIEPTETHLGGEGGDANRIVPESLLNRNLGEDVSGVASGDSTGNPSR